jgi:hypothetical protein
MSGQKIVPFLFEGEGLVRVIDRDGSPWFVAKDVCGALGIVWKGSDSTGPLSGMDESIAQADGRLAYVAGELEKDAASAYRTALDLDKAALARPASQTAVDGMERLAKSVLAHNLMVEGLVSMMEHSEPLPWTLEAVLKSGTDLGNEAEAVRAAICGEAPRFGIAA